MRECGPYVGSPSKILIETEASTESVYPLAVGQLSWGDFMRANILTAFCFLIGTCALALAQPASDLAPNGTLRVGVLLSNPVLVTKKPDGTLGGVSIDLGRMIAAKLGARYQEVPYQTTDTFAKSFGAGEWDIAIGPRTPVAESKADLSPPFMFVDNIYVAVAGKQFLNASEVDRPGVRIAVVVDGAPDQYLSRNLKAATLVRILGATPEIVEALRAGRADVYGSNAENVHAAARSLPGSKILPGAFRTVSMVVAYPKGKSVAAQDVIKALVAEARSSGLVKKAIDAGSLKGVRVAAE
jgi:polar amino acid transport system substrate-binding protein